MKSPAKKSRPDYGSPPEFVNLAHGILGEISVDPFSHAKWNGLIRARRFGSLPGGGGSFDGFADPWFAGAPSASHLLGDHDWSDAHPRLQIPNTETALVNAPGDPTGRNVKQAWRILSEYVDRNYLGGGALWIGFSLSQLGTLQGEGRWSPLSERFTRCRCVPRARACYLVEPGKPQDQPDRPSWLLLIPGNAEGGKLGMRQLAAWAALAPRLGEVF